MKRLIKLLVRMRRAIRPAPFVAVSKDEYLHPHEGTALVFHRTVHHVCRRRDGKVLRTVGVFELAQQQAQQLNEEWARLTALNARSK